MLSLYEIFLEDWIVYNMVLPISNSEISWFFCLFFIRQNLVENNDSFGKSNYSPNQAKKNHKNLWNWTLDQTSKIVKFLEFVIGETLKTGQDKKAPSQLVSSH